MSRNLPLYRLAGGLALLCGLAICPQGSFSQTLVDHPTIPGLKIPAGYQLRPAVTGLNFPSNITFGPEGKAWVTEAGFPGVPPTVKELTLPETGMGTAKVILSPALLPMGTLVPPFTDVTYNKGYIWLSHRQVGANGWNVGAISRFDPTDPAGTFVTAVTNLPSVGDHSNNTIVFGPDGRAYFGQGSATNSAVVGPDNVPRWVADAPGFHEIPAVDITLNGDSFVARIPTPLDPDSNAVTAPYRPFDSGDIEPGFVARAASYANPVNGIIAGSGTVYSFDPMASVPAGTLRLEAWGLRNPFGLTFDAQDSTRLFISNNGSDIRGQATDPSDPFNTAKFEVQGSRPIAEDYDDLFEITTGGEVEFFGWPDFLHDPTTKEVKRVDDPLFCQSPVLTAGDCPKPLFDASFGASLSTKAAFTEIGRYVSVTGLEASSSETFGYAGDLFVTESGSYPPQTGTFAFTGYKVARVDRESGEASDFVVNVGSTPEEIFAPGKLHKPVSAAFQGDRLAIVDLGILEPGINIFQPNSGAVWVLERTPVQQGVNTGKIFTPEGEETVYVCPGSGNSEPITVVPAYATAGGQVAYVITDENFDVLKVSPTNGIDLSGAGVGTCYIWAFNYTGNILIAAGDPVFTTRFSDDMFLISNNAIRAIRQAPVAGTISSNGSGNTVEYACIGDGQPDYFGFRVEGRSGAGSAYVITDGEDKILMVNTTGFQNFEPAGVGNCRVYSLSYTGDITAMPGDDVQSTELSDGCFDLSDQWLTIVRNTPSQSTVSVDGQQVISLPSGATVTAQNTATGSSKYAYVLLESDFVIDAISTDGTFSLAGATPGKYFVYGVSFFGDNLLSVGGTFFGTRVSQACWFQSDNAVVLNVTDGDGLVGFTPVTISRGVIRIDMPEESSALVQDFDRAITPANETVVTVADALGRIVKTQTFAAGQALDGALIAVPQATEGVHVVSLRQNGSIRSKRVVF